jgi:hypothetical protein
MLVDLEPSNPFFFSFSFLIYFVSNQNIIKKGATQVHKEYTEDTPTLKEIISQENYEN